MSNNCDKWLLSRLEEGKVTHPYTKDLDILKHLLYLF